MKQYLVSDDIIKAMARYLQVRPRRKALDEELASYVPTDISDVDGEVKNADGKTIATVVDGVVVLLP